MNSLTKRLILAVVIFCFIDKPLAYCDPQFWENKTSILVFYTDSLNHYKQLRSSVPNLRPSEEAWLEGELKAGGTRASKASMGIEWAQRQVGRNLDVVITNIEAVIEYHQIKLAQSKGSAEYNLLGKNEAFHLLEAARFVSWNFANNLLELIENKILPRRFPAMSVTSEALSVHFECSNAQYSMISAAQEALLEF